MQLIEVIRHSGKIKTVDDLLNNFNSITELARDDIYKIAKSKRILFADFDFAYGEGVKMLRSQLQKSHLKGIKRFLECENIDNAITWLIRRILANMRNITTNKKFRLYCAPSFAQLHENIKSNNDIKIVLELIELEKFDRDTLKNGLQKMLVDSMFDEDFDHFDVEYLCKKFKFEMSEIVGAQVMNLQKYKKEQTESGHLQLVFVF